MPLDKISRRKADSDFHEKKYPDILNFNPRRERMVNLIKIHTTESYRFRRSYISITIYSLVDFHQPPYIIHRYREDAAEFFGSARHARDNSSSPPPPVIHHSFSFVSLSMKSFSMNRELLLPPLAVTPRNFSRWNRITGEGGWISDTSGNNSEEGNVNSRLLIHARRREKGRQ